MKAKLDLLDDINELERKSNSIATENYKLTPTEMDWTKDTVNNINAEIDRLRELLFPPSTPDFDVD